MTLSIYIDGSAKEIAALALELQERREGRKFDITVDGERVMPEKEEAPNETH